MQKNRQDNANFYFADGSTPDKRDDTLKNWSTRSCAWRSTTTCRRAGTKTPNATPGAPLSGEVLLLRFFDGGEELWLRELLALSGPRPGHGRGPQQQQQDYFARTETTGIGLVRLLAVTAESALQDAEKW